MTCIGVHLVFCKNTQIPSVFPLQDKIFRAYPDKSVISCKKSFENRFLPKSDKSICCLLDKSSCITRQIPSNFSIVVSCKTKQIRYIVQKQTSQKFITMNYLFNMVFPVKFLRQNKCWPMA